MPRPWLDPVSPSNKNISVSSFLLLAFFYNSTKSLPAGDQHPSKACHITSHTTSIERGLSRKALILLQLRPAISASHFDTSFSIESMVWAPEFMLPIEEDEDDEMAEGGDFQNGDAQDGDAWDDGFEVEFFENEMSQDEVFQDGNMQDGVFGDNASQDAYHQDEILQDEASEDEASQDTYPQDEASHDAPTPPAESNRIPSQRVSDGSKESYAKILTYVKSIRRTPSEASVLESFCYL